MISEKNSNAHIGSMTVDNIQHNTEPSSMKNFSWITIRLTTERNRTFIGFWAQKCCQFLWKAKSMEVDNSLKKAWGDDIIAHHDKGENQRTRQLIASLAARGSYH